MCGLGVVGGGTQTASPASACLPLLSQAQKGDRHPWIPGHSPSSPSDTPFGLTRDLPSSLPFFSSFYQWEINIT